MDFEIGYWGIKFRAEPVRLVLAHVKNTSYTEFNPTSREEYLERIKGHPFPNLPYILTKDGKYCLTETDAVLQYVAAKCGRNDLLGGGDIRRSTRVEEILEVQADILGIVMKTAHLPDPVKAKEGTIEGMKVGGSFDKKINFLIAFLGNFLSKIQIFPFLKTQII